MVMLMKKKNIMQIIATVCLAMTGCMKTNKAIDSDLFVIYANRESLNQTKTELQADNSIVWTQNDELSLFFEQGSNGGYKYVSTSSDKDGCSVFKATGETYDNNPSAYWAIYPYSEHNSFDGNTFTTVLPFVQTAKAGSFNNNLFISVAESSSNHMTFYNVCGGIKFSVPYDNIREVMIINNDGGMLSGTLKIKIQDDELPELESITDGSSVLRIISPFGETFSIGENYYAVIPPVLLTKGITVKYLTTSGKECSEVIQSPTTIERSVFTRMPRIEANKDFYYSPFLTFVSEGESTVAGYFPVVGTTEYSYDGINWTECNYGSKISITKSCPSFFLRGLNSEINSIILNKQDTPIFKMTGDKIGCYGSVMKLLDYSSNLDCVPAYCFASMFKNCKQLTHAPELPAITVGAGAYYSMFEGCSSLENTPELPATTISNYCYQSMFQSCSSLKTGPKILPALQVAKKCYGSMFNHCRSLTSAPELPAITMKEGCYENMFSSCTSLIVAPDLPATTLDSGCYSYMFHNCTSLTSIPDILPATILAETCYCSMFANCTSIIQAPSLPAEELAGYCYWDMFSGCTSLKQAPKLPASTLLYNCYDSMFAGCSSLTSAPELRATKMVRECYKYMFKDCTSLTEAPNLPAVSLYDGCYQGMFSGCTALLSAPKLPATNLSGSCYSEMFFNCSSLKAAPALPSETLVGYCYKSMFSGCSLLDTAPDLPALTAKSYCYQSMFSGCSSLIKAPKIAATKLDYGCFKEMFSGCTSLTEGPVLYSIDLCSSAYEKMFQGCTRLRYIKAMFINNITQNALLGWLAGVSPTGTFVKNASATWNNSEAGIPDGWTVEYATE